MGKHLITGGAGMIGSHLARRLVNSGEDVVVADNLMSGSIKNILDLIGRDNFKFAHEDMRDEKICIELGEGMDNIWAIAANMGGILMITDVAADIVRDNIRLNINALESCRINKVPKYFYASSACVYPNFLQTSEWAINLKEESAIPADPNEAYGWEKLFAEQCVMAYQKDYGLNIRIARFHNIYGNAFTAFDKKKGKAPCHMIIKCIKHPNPEWVVWGDGRATRSYCYIDDCIDGILALMDSDYDKPINIGTDRSISVDALAELVIKISGKDVQPEHDLTKPVGVRGRNADLSLCKEKLGWSPKIELEDGMKVVYDWAVANFDELENI